MHLFTDKDGQFTPADYDQVGMRVRGLHNKFITFIPVKVVVI
jgi:hypothetical protein